ncbi:MAG: ATP synthase F1 subunit delta [Deltaproteobacteria bacterium]|nr:MAG: ATP synthase F1 subunit delta [Deltaproteobacteria bacterium]
MSGRRLAKRYARALFSLTRDALISTAEELGRVAAVLEEPRLKLVLRSPAVDASARLRIARQVAAALELSPGVGNLLCLLAERDRLDVLSDIAATYEQLVDDALGRARALIRSATPLSGAEKNDLVDLARRLTGRREVLATTEVDAELLGGVVLYIDGTVYDGSLRAQLVRLSKQMAEGRA